MATEATPSALSGLGAEAENVVTLVEDVVEDNFFGALVEALTVGPEIEANIQAFIAAHPQASHAITAIGAWIAARWPQNVPADNPDALALESLMGASNLPGK